MTNVICQCSLCTGKPFDSLQLTSLDGGDFSMNSTSASSLSSSSSSSTVSFQSFGSAGIKELDMVKRVQKGMAKPLANNGSTLSTLQSIGDYTFLNFLHQGNNAQIKMAEHRTTRERVAVKITPRANKYALLNIPSDAENKNEYKTRETGALERLRDKHAYREAQILLLLRHPYLPRIYDFISTADHHYLVMEHVNGIPLLFRVIQQEYLSEASARHYAHQVWRILDYLHGHAIVHLDIRIDNLILKQEQDQIKLLDFSTACLYLGWKKEEKQALYKRQHLCRSIHYTAPELLDPSNETFEGPPVDIWNFGILIYIMVTGEMPFEGYSPEQVSRHIQSIDPQGKDNKQGHPHPHLRYLDRLSPECRHLIQSMLAINPRERISLAQVAQHPWFRSLSSPPPPSDIQIRKPLKPPLDPFVIQLIAHAFRTLGSPQRIAKKLTAIIQKSNKDPHSPEYHPFVLLYHLHQERLAFPEQLPFENDYLSIFGEQEDVEYTTAISLYGSMQGNRSDSSSFIVPIDDPPGGLQLVFNTSSAQQQQSPPLSPLPQHEESRSFQQDEQLSPSLNSPPLRPSHNQHHHPHQKSRLLRRIKNWYTCKIVRCKK